MSKSKKATTPRKSVVDVHACKVKWLIENAHESINLWDIYKRTAETCVEIFTLYRARGSHACANK